MKTFLLATMVVALATSAASAAPVLANGPEPYSAPNPEGPIIQEAALPQLRSVPALLSQESDSGNALAAGPQPYQAPNPAE